MATNLEQVAAERGYPSHCFGYTPNEGAYWVEPGMPWVMPLLNPAHYGLDPVACADELAGLMAFSVWNDNMAPRFAHGSFLAGRPVACGQPLVVGQVLAWLDEGDAPDCFSLARVTSLANGVLHLACDNGGHALTLAWVAGSPVNAYRITHYVTQPSEL